MQLGRLIPFLLLLLPAAAWAAEPIDRGDVVSRHDVLLNRFDTDSPLSVGNGHFCFTVDATGLQTFPQAFESTTPLGTLSDWGWHSAPNPGSWSIDKYKFTEFESHGRSVGYADIPNEQRTPEVEYLRANPHRLHLGQIGFLLTKSNGDPARPEDITEVNQLLDLWVGVVESHFDFDGHEVDVLTICDPKRDLIAVDVKSELIKLGRLAVRIRFPYGTGSEKTADWQHPDAHSTKLSQITNAAARFDRKLDDTTYSVALSWQGSGALSPTGGHPNEAHTHEFILTPSADKSGFNFSCEFTPQPSTAKPPDFIDTLIAVRHHWQEFWSTGGAIDLSRSRDPRWRELERRIVLSQYLTAIQCSGRFPPAETGLTYNSWNGKFHLEMHWWHAVQFALWGRFELLERSLGFYQTILPQAQAIARRQGYAGARWPKMTDPSGAESPSTVGPFLIWQQPHPIYYAELAYREHADRDTLEKYRDIVFETAKFMASYATWDDATQRYVLGPPLHSAQEVFPKATTINPTFELTYWRWGLETAQKWRERLGLARDPDWDRVLDHFAKPLVVDGKYAFTETAPDSFTNPRWRTDHPIVLGSFGMLPGPGIDRPTMRRTLDWAWDNWNWPTTWGWDYPLAAMCAARLGEPDRAVDALLMDTPKNTYRPNGHNHQRPGLTIYLPGNGGLLTAIAMMSSGWDGAPASNAPGFPGDGNWKVRWEGLQPLP